MTQRVFLETTVQIRRLLYAPSIRQTIQGTLQAYETLTSTYVWMEVQRTVGQDFRYLIDLILDRQPPTIPRLISYLGESRGIFSSRSLGRMIQIVAQLLDELHDPAIEPIEVVYLLRRQCTWMLHHEFFVGVDHVLDTTMCDLVRPDYTVVTGGRMSCRRETARCALPDLLNDHADALQQLQADTSALTALNARTRRALREITSDPNQAKGERNCWSLGDLIIVLECPPDAALWSTNLSHFEPLCRVLGRLLFRPDV